MDFSRHERRSVFLRFKKSFTSNVHHAITHSDKSYLNNERYNVPYFSTVTVLINNKNLSWDLVIVHPKGILIISPEIWDAYIGNSSSFCDIFSYIIWLWKNMPFVLGWITQSIIDKKNKIIGICIYRGHVF